MAPCFCGKTGESTKDRFYSVGEAATLLKTSRMTLYREIDARKFPAIRIRGRIVVPARAIDAMEEAALSQHSVVLAEDFVDPATTHSYPAPAS